jgi:Protein of unknwon function (DUF3310)
MQEQNETVMVPQHYARWPIEPIYFAMVNSLDYARGNILKYILRWDMKDGLIDLYKAERYLDQYSTLKEEEAAKVPASEMTFHLHPSPATALERFLRRNRVTPTDSDITELEAYIMELKEANYGGPALSA